MKIFPVKVDTLDKNYDVFSKIVRGITHDYNNLLTPILAYPELIKTDIKEGAKGTNLLKVIETTAHELLKINRQLMHIISAGSGQKKDVDVDSLIESLKDSINGVDGSCGISLDITCKNNMAIKCHNDDIIIALQKIVLNAWDAMDHKGSVRIIVERTKLPKEKVHSNTGTGDKSYVCFSIIDTGVGIESRHINSIFEPFFTTKKTQSKRTIGLGLSLAYRLIVSNEGFVGVESVAGQGTTINVYLPAV